jgi:hypothetical protein
MKHEIAMPVTALDAIEYPLHVSDLALVAIALPLASLTHTHAEGSIGQSKVLQPYDDST